MKPGLNALLGMLIATVAAFAQRQAPFALEEMRMVAGPGGFSSPLWSPASASTLAFSSADSSQIWIFDTGSMGRPQAMASGQGIGFRFAWSSDGAAIYARERLTGGLSVMREIDSRSSQSRALGPAAKSIGLPQLLPSGELAYRRRRQAFHYGSHRRRQRRDSPAARPHCRGGFGERAV